MGWRDLELDSRLSFCSTNACVEHAGAVLRVGLLLGYPLELDGLCCSHVKPGTMTDIWMFHSVSKICY